jgi:hypothetical protein
MTKHPFKKAAPDLTALGYHAIPITPRGKFPAWIRDGQWINTIGWQKWRDEAPSDDDLAYWSTMPQANIGIVLGTRLGDHQLVAVDIDVEDPDEIADLMGTLPVTPMEKRGAKGTTLFYLADPEVRSRGYRTKSKKALADLLTGNATKQTVVPPSVHPDGPVYTWVRGPVPVDELPILTADHLDEFHEMLESLGWQEGEETELDEHGNRVKIAKSADFSDDPFAAVKVDALAHLDLWVSDLSLYGLTKSAAGYRAVPDFRPSGSGARIEDRKASLSITTTGIKDHGDDKGYSAVDLVMATEKLSDHEACSWLEDRLYDDTIAPRQNIIAGPSSISANDDDPEDFSDIDEEDLSDELVEFEHVTSHDHSAPWRELPTFCDPITIIAEHIQGRAKNDLEAFSLMGALATYSTVIGRQYSTPFKQGSLNLYMLGLAPSGAGKTHYVKAPADMLHAASLSLMIGPSEWTAGTVFENHVERQPIALCLIDEFGDTMQRMTDPKASPAQQSRAKPLKEMYSVGYGFYATSDMAQRKSVSIRAPHVSILAMSTPQKLYTNLTEEALEEGFVNRWLIVPVQGKKTTKAQREAELMAQLVADGQVQGNTRTPNHIISILKGAQTARDPQGEEHRFSNPSSLAGLSAGELEPLRVDWASEGAQRLWAKYAVHCLSDELCKTEIIRNLFARSAENALRIASVFAVANHAYKGHALEVTEEMIDFAIRFVEWCSRSNYAQLGQNIGGSARTAGVRDKMLSYIEAKPRTRRQVVKNFKGRVDTVKDIDAHLQLLLEAGLIMKNESSNEHGRATVRFIARKGGHKMG